MGNAWFMVSSEHDDCHCLIRCAEKKSCAELAKDINRIVKLAYRNCVDDLAVTDVSDENAYVSISLTFQSKESWERFCRDFFDQQEA